MNNASASLLLCVIDSKLNPVFMSVDEKFILGNCNRMNNFRKGNLDYTFHVMAIHLEEFKPPSI